jgi:hypothetical protein
VRVVATKPPLADHDTAAHITQAAQGTDDRDHPGRRTRRFCDQPVHSHQHCRVVRAGVVHPELGERAEQAPVLGGQDLRSYGGRLVGRRGIACTPDSDMLIATPFNREEWRS